MLNNIKHIILATVAVTLSNFLPLQSLADDNQSRSFDYSDYTLVLNKYVNEQGIVNYKKLKGNPAKLNSFVAGLVKLDPNSYDGWTEKEKIAFWLNAYNAFTLKSIIDNYPIKPDFFKSMYYPKNSIRQIPGVWNKITFTVMSKDYTLEHIEHKILRKEFKEPRIHMAMVCAAMGCPPLRNEPYIGKRLDEQLDDQSRKFLANSEKFRFDSKKREFHISPIFKWFGDDFVKAKAKKKPFIQYSNKEAAILEFVSKYLAEDHAFFDPSKRAVRIKYLDYDWSLNEQR
jgi:hypothetical protein